MGALYFADLLGFQVKSVYLRPPKSGFYSVSFIVAMSRLPGACSSLSPWILYRNVVTAYSEYRIAICRSCRVTISLLPSFLLPRFQCCRITILEAIKEFLASGIRRLYRQIITFYINRFRQNMMALIFSFREVGLMLKVPPDDTEKAIKLIELLLDTWPVLRATNPKFNSTLWHFHCNQLRWILKDFFTPHCFCLVYLVC
jgi:hypothetical protein